jgi:hypothetical protein
MSSQIIPLKGRSDSWHHSEFRSQRLFACELRRPDTRLGPSDTGHRPGSPPRAKSLYLVGKADVGRRHVSDRQHGGQSWTSSHRHHEETGEFRSIQVFDFVKHAPDHDTVLKRYETSLDAMATTRRPYTR